MARDRRPQLSDLDVEIPMGFAQVGATLARCIATVVLVLFPHSWKQCSNRGCFRALPVRAGEDARESDPVQGGAADIEETTGVSNCAVGRKLSGEWGMVELSDSLIKTRAKIKPGHKSYCATTGSTA